MLSFKNKYILYLVLLNGLLTTLLVLEGRAIFETAHPISGMAVALVIFLVYELLVILFMEKKGKTMPVRKSVNVFLGFKLGKIFLSLLFIAIYAFVVEVELKRFVMVFIALYFIYLFFDTVFMLNWEKDNKKKIIYDKNEAFIA